MSVAIHLDASDPTPPFEQVRRQIAHGIASGALTGGVRLPTVRQLAADLGVAPGTVMRAYRELEVEGLIATRRGAGSVVQPGRALGDPEVLALARSFVSRARAAGAGDAAIRTALETAFDEPE